MGLLCRNINGIQLLVWCRSAAERWGFFFCPNTTYKKWHFLFLWLLRNCICFTRSCFGGFFCFFSVVFLFFGYFVSWTSLPLKVQLYFCKIWQVFAFIHIHFTIYRLSWKRVLWKPRNPVSPASRWGIWFSHFVKTSHLTTGLVVKWHLLHFFIKMQ